MNIVLPVVFAIASIFAITKTLIDKKRAEKIMETNQVQPQVVSNTDADKQSSGLKIINIFLRYEISKKHRIIPKLCQL